MNPQEILSGADSRIDRIRKTEATVKVVDRRGVPLAGVFVEVEQTSHAFLFGSTVEPVYGNLDANHQQRVRDFTDLFNYATLTFYWGVYEPEQGQTQPRREQLERVALWCNEQRIATKGHPLVWQVLYPQWAPNDPDAVKPLLCARVREIVSGFKGLIDRWDVVNEATDPVILDNGIGNWVKRDGPVAMVMECIEWAREANPKATLLYNDWNVSPAFEQLMEDLMRRGAPFDVIGIQAHMHRGEWTLERVWQVCETYGRFGKPLHFTETTVISGQHGWELPRPWQSTPDGEWHQAKYVESLYTTLFSHPSVEAITWWEMLDGGWMGAPAGLVREDVSVKPAYQRLKRLIKGKWWTRVTLRTNIRGEASLRGFLGDYRVTAAGTTGKRTHKFTLSRGRNAWLIRLG